MYKFRQSKKFYTLHRDSYKKLQEEQKRPGDVRQLVLKLNDQACNERYERAYEAYHSQKIGIGKRIYVAVEIRTLLDGIKGALLEKARKSQKEQIAWTIMSQRISKNGENSIECYDLIRQENIRSALYDDLSAILKDREATTIKNLDDIWVESLDHIFTMLSLIRLR